jgi:hypothetical protein
MISIRTVSPIAACFALVLCLSLGTVSARAQAEEPGIRPGNASLDTTPIRAGTDSLAIVVVEEDEGFIIGSYILKTSIQNNLITRTERMMAPGGVVIWGEEISLEDGTLRLRSVTAADVRRDHIEVDGSVITRRWDEDGDPQERTAILAHPSFYPNSLDLVLRSLPLGDGFAATLVLLDPDDLEELLVPVHVERAVALADYHGVNSNTWEVHVHLDGAVDIYHLEQETHELIRYESAAQRLVMLRW